MIHIIIYETKQKNMEANSRFPYSKVIDFLLIYISGGCGVTGEKVFVSVE